MPVSADPECCEESYYLGKILTMVENAVLKFIVFSPEMQNKYILILYLVMNMITSLLQNMV